MKQTDDFLSGKTILVTRPLNRAENLCRLIESAGGKALPFPVIEIVAASNTTELQRMLSQLDSYDIAIFISPTAVEQSLPLISCFPEHLQIAAIGNKTSQLLQQYGVNVDIHNEGHNSESLLKHPALQTDRLNGKKVIIFRGQGGRAFLGDNLLARGASVNYAESYQRRCPEEQSLSTTDLTSLNAIIVNSNEGLHNLMKLIPDHDLLLAISLVVISEKMLTTARTYGFRSVYLADNATDEACFHTIKKLFS